VAPPVPGKGADSRRLGLGSAIGAERVCLSVDINVEGRDVLLHIQDGLWCRIL
jgi:hypothetical protein